MSRAKPASGEFSPGGRVMSSTAVAPAEQPASRTSTKMATSQRREVVVGWSLRGVVSMQIFY